MVTGFSMLRDPALIPLSHDHQHALALCVQIRRTLAGTDPAYQDLAVTVVHQFDSEMRDHFEVEEGILFPLMSAFDSTRALVADLISEHRRVIALTDKLRVDAAPDLLAEFADVVTQHVRREEGVLFEEAQRLLPREELNRVGALLARRSSA